MAKTSKLMCNRKCRYCVAVLKYVFIGSSASFRVDASEIMAATNNNKFVQPAHQEYLMEIHVNDVAEPEAVVCYINNNDKNYIPASVLQRHNVQMESIKPQDDGFFCVNDVPWITNKVDTGKQELRLTVPADKFREQLISARPEKKLQLSTQEQGLSLTMI